MSCRRRWRRGLWAEGTGLEPVGEPAERARTGEPHATGRGLLRRGLPKLLLYGVPGHQRGDRKLCHGPLLLNRFKLMARRIA
jgi:hypothetical protein